MFGPRIRLNAETALTRVHYGRVIVAVSDAVNTFLPRDSTGCTRASNGVLVDSCANRIGEHVGEELIQPCGLTERSVHARIEFIHQAPCLARVRRIVFEQRGDFAHSSSRALQRALSHSRGMFSGDDAS